MSVEWHEFSPGYRISFDVRADASRFIVCVGERVIAQGLIDVHGVLYDREHAPEPVERELRARWSAMQTRLRNEAAR